MHIRFDEVDEFLLGVIVSDFILEEGESLIGLCEVGIVLVGCFGDKAVEEEGIFLPLLVEFVLLVVEFALHSGDPLFHGYSHLSKLLGVVLELAVVGGQEVSDGSGEEVELFHVDVDLEEVLEGFAFHL